MAIYDVSTNEKKASPSLVAGGTLYADSPLGTILPFGGSSIPSGWLLCDGTAVSRTTYSELFAVIGESFGAGDGSTTFNLPDMRESVPKGAGLTGKTVGNHLDADGLAVGEFLDDQLQAHTHSNKTGSSTAGLDAWTMFASNRVETSVEQTNNGAVGRFGATTEVKSVGVNYIIKAKMVGIPADFMDKVEDAVEDVFANNVGHNSIYRGKYLGSAVTEEQYAQISAGTFKDLFIGDYWTIGGVNYRIAAFDYWLNTGDTSNKCTTHHVVLVPDTNFYTTVMNSSDDTTGGYTNSAMYTSNLANAKTTISSAFGSAHILNHRELFVNAVDSDGKASAWGWEDSTVDLMNESMVYGHNAWGSHPGYETGIDRSQFPLFAMAPEYITKRSGWHLRGVVSSTEFAGVSGDGQAGRYAASYVLGVCPAFAICA